MPWDPGPGGVCAAATRALATVVMCEKYNDRSNDETKYTRPCGPHLTAFTRKLALPLSLAPEQVGEVKTL